MEGSVSMGLGGGGVVVTDSQIEGWRSLDRCE